jgi:hypothetical protein
VVMSMERKKQRDEEAKKRERKEFGEGWRL